MTCGSCYYYRANTDEGNFFNGRSYRRGKCFLNPPEIHIQQAVAITRENSLNGDRYLDTKGASVLMLRPDVMGNDFCSMYKSV